MHRIILFLLFRYFNRKKSSYFFVPISGRWEGFEIGKLIRFDNETFEQVSINFSRGLIQVMKNNVSVPENHFIYSSKVMDVRIADKKYSFIEYFTILLNGTKGPNITMQINNTNPDDIFSPQDHKIIIEYKPREYTVHLTGKLSIR